MSHAIRSFTSVLGRFCLSLIFLISGTGKILDWSGTVQHARSEGLVAVEFLLGMAILFEIGGGLSVLLGYRARLGTLALIVFLIPTTLIFHDFWQYEGQAAQLQIIHFLKNTAILGGLLLVFTHGAGPASLDARKRPV